MTYNVFGGTLNPTLVHYDLLCVSWDVKPYSFTHTALIASLPKQPSE